MPHCADKLFLWCLVLLSGCGQNEDSNTIENDRLNATLDTLRAPVAAAYEHKDGFSIITSNPPQKITTVAGVFFTETLLHDSDRLFRSHLYSFLYRVGDEHVEELFLRKIVHPSSNWQGQTPGTDTVRTVYRRVDNKNANFK